MNHRWRDGSICVSTLLFDDGLTLLVASHTDLRIGNSHVIFTHIAESIAHTTAPMALPFTSTDGLLIETLATSA